MSLALPESQIQQFDPLEFSMPKDMTIPYNDRNIYNEFTDTYNECYGITNSFYIEAQRDLNFFLGKQWSDDELRMLHAEGRSAYTFNKTMRVINMITGYQRKHRLASVAAPVEDSDQKTSDQLTKLQLHVMQLEGYECISNAFSGALKTGINFIEIWKDYREDPIDGDIRYTRVPYNGILIDPYFTKLDLSDCNYILRRNFMSRFQASSIIPDAAELIMELPKYSPDSKFTYMAQNSTDIPEDLLAVDEFWKCGYRQMIMVLDPMTGQSGEIEPDPEAIMYIMQAVPGAQIIPFYKKYVERTLLIGKEVVSMEMNPEGIEVFPFVPFVAEFEPESDLFSMRWQSAIRRIRDPQMESNKRRSQMTDILESSINSGYIAKEDSVVNPRSLFQSGQGKVTWIKGDYQLTDVQPRPSAQIPPSMFQLQQLYDQDMLDILGVNQELLGAASDDDPGITVKLRQGAGLITLQNYFDRLSVSQKCLGNLTLKFLQQWSPNKVMRIIGEQPTQEFYSKDFGKYDCVVQEGMLTDTQRAMFFYQLIKLKELGEPIPPMLLTKAAPIQGKSDLYKEIQEYSEQQSKLAQEQQQIAEEDRKATLDFTKSQTEYSLAGAEERQTRALSNIGLLSKNLSEADENEGNAVLDRAKAIKELESMDISSIERLLNIIKKINPEKNLMQEITNERTERFI